MKKDKQKVIGEVFDKERILSFFDQQPPANENADFYLLLRAYRGMTEDSFSQFVDLFVEKGHNLNSQNADGQTLVDIIAKHRHATPYIAAIKKYETTV